MTKALNNDIAIRLSAARRVCYPSARNFTQAHNIAESTYSQHENGKRALSVNALWEYSEWLSVDPGWLLTGRGLPYPNEKDNTEKQAKLFHYLDSLDQQQLYEEEQRYLIKDGIALVDVSLLREVIGKLIASMENAVNVDAETFLEVVFDTYNVVVQTSAKAEDKARMIDLSVNSLVKGLETKAKDDVESKSA